MDLAHITPCGGNCTPCKKWISGFCRGCIPERGRVPEWKESGGCPIFLCAQQHAAPLCGLCPDFPCAKLPKIAFWEPDIIQKQEELARAFRSAERMRAAAVQIVSVAERPELLPHAAQWFHEKWGIPEDTYRKSMEESLLNGHPIPQWYIALKDEQIIGGLGVIENDFHDRPDLAPNICAVFVEESHRRQGIAGALLERACRDMTDMGIHTLYLLTDHTGFYERYGWKFYCMAHGDGEDHLSRLYRKITPP